MTGRHVRRFLEEEPAKVHAPERPLQRRPDPVSTTRSTTRRAGPNRAPRPPPTTHPRPPASAARHADPDRAHTVRLIARALHTATTPLTRPPRGSSGEPLSGLRRPTWASGRPVGHVGANVACRHSCMAFTGAGRRGRSSGGAGARYPDSVIVAVRGDHDTIRAAERRSNARTTCRRPAPWLSPRPTNAPRSARSITLEERASA